MTPRDRFINFLVAREAMRVHKELVGGPGPHSEDPILANHRFCNINREHDTVTRFIHQEFRVPFKDMGKQFMVRQMLFCRIFNEPKTLMAVCPFRDKDSAVKALKAYRNTGVKMMRGAYMMPPHGKNIGGVDIIDHWCEVVEHATGVAWGDWPAVEAKVHYNPMTTLKEVAEGLMRVIGIGPFIANQVCADLRYIPVWGHDWTDWQSFILAGPGTRRGVNRYYNCDPTQSGTDAAFTQSLLTIREDLHKDIPQTIRDYYRDPNNLSNSFCEFDKYERARAQLEGNKEVTLRHWEASDESEQLNLL